MRDGAFILRAPLLSTRSTASTTEHSKRANPTAELSGARGTCPAKGRRGSSLAARQPWEPCSQARTSVDRSSRSVKGQHHPLSPSPLTSLVT